MYAVNIVFADTNIKLKVIEVYMYNFTPKFYILYIKANSQINRIAVLADIVHVNTEAHLGPYNFATTQIFC
jgi:hypothetical protein